MLTNPPIPYDLCIPCLLCDFADGSFAALVNRWRYWSVVTGEAGRCIFVTVSQFVAAITAQRDSAPPEKMSGLTHLESSSSERLCASHWRPCRTRYGCQIIQNFLSSNLNWLFRDIFWAKISHFVPYLEVPSPSPTLLIAP